MLIIETILTPMKPAKKPNHSDMAEPLYSGYHWFSEKVPAKERWPL